MGERFNLGTRFFIDHPEYVMNPEYAWKIMLIGMTEGLFTGAKLSQYIKPNSYNYKGARKIINGTDQDDLIASQAKVFEKALLSI